VRARVNPISHLVALAARVSCEQPRQPISDESLAPAIDVAVAAIELGTRPVQPFEQQQDQTGVSRRIGSTVPRASLPLMLNKFGPGQLRARRTASSCRVLVVVRDVLDEPKPIGSIG